MTGHGCTIELMEILGDIGVFECECGEQYELPIDADGEPLAGGAERSDP